MQCKPAVIAPSPCYAVAVWQVSRPGRPAESLIDDIVEECRE